MEPLRKHESSLAKYLPLFALSNNYIKIQALNQYKNSLEMVKGVCSTNQLEIIHRSSIFLSAVSVYLNCFSAWGSLNHNYCNLFVW